MPKIPFSDVTPPSNPNRRSIRDIPIPNSGKRKIPFIIAPEKEPIETIEPEVFNVPISNPSPNINSNFNSNKSPMTESTSDGPYEYYYPKNKKEAFKPQIDPFPKSRRKNFIFGTIIAILIAVFIVGMMTVFSSATIDITPKSEQVNVDTQITGMVGETVGDTVRYEVIKLSESKTVSVPATGEEAAEIKASGKIIIYNDFSIEPQRLIVRTRFETPDGLIFRIPESVVVPGKTVKAGVETPGSIEVQVFADEAGDNYNIKKTDFTIPGFKTDAVRYKNFYARSSTNMVGGFIGKAKKVADADKAAALQSIDTETQTDLAKNLETKIPEGLVLLQGSIVYKSEDLAPKEETSSVQIGKNVTAYALMLNKQDLSNKIVSEYIASSSDWKNIKAVVSDFSSLKIANIPASLENNDNIDLQIKGVVKVFADIDQNIISQKLLGAPKGDVVNLMDEFAGISSITATIRPIWKQSFPKNPSKIYVQIITNQ
jgi:hypothetical protein